VKEILAITTEEFPTPAVRPSNSRLSTAKLMQDFAVELPDWRDGLVEELNQLRI
jgi:dTDP-4-dehydrorhamnose reductase